MEPLSGVASGMAVVSLSLQLLQSINDVKTFIHNVKDASKELERLTDLLERLEGILEDVRDIMERQSSLEGQHFPAPSTTIFKCLKSCGKTLQPLQDIVKKVTASHAQDRSTFARLRDDVKLGFKAKDIAAFETRIDREINYLHAALGSNSTAIIINALPALLQNQQTVMTIQPNLPMRLTLISNSTATVDNSAVSAKTRPQQRSPRVQVSCTPSILEKIGIYRRTLMRYRYSVNSDGNINITQYDQNACSQEEEHSIMWTMIGYGMTWSLQRSYGRVLPYLTVYPVVENFSDEVCDLICRGSLHDIEHMLSSGSIHPFTRDSAGQSLLHLAAYGSNTNVCQLLLASGLKPDRDKFNRSPIETAHFWYIPRSDSVDDELNFHRLFLEGGEKTDDCATLNAGRMPLDSLRPETLQWLWNYYANNLCDEDALVFRNSMIKHLWQGIYWFAVDGRPQFPEFIMEDNILECIRNGGHELLHLHFNCCRNMSTSYVYGAAFLEWLLKLGLDVEVCMAQFIEHNAGGFLLSDVREQCADRKIILQGNNEHGWSLGFEWAFDWQAPGYILVCEFAVLAGDEYNAQQWYYPWDSEEERDRKSAQFWPFDGNFYHDRHQHHSDAQVLILKHRFNRRMATKECKERARTGQKRLKSKMPGRWI